MQFYDLDSERTLCQIDEIIRAKHDKAANLAGYDNCAYCIGNSSR